VPQLPITVVVIGCGVISGIYLTTRKTFRVVDVVACADLDLERARVRAAESGVPRACGVDELLTDPGVDLVVNLTVPGVHTEVGVAAIEAGKCLYAEKSQAIDRAAGQRMLDLARDKGLLIGSAPDTCLRRPRFPQWYRRNHHHKLRCLGHEPPPNRSVRHSGRAERPRPQHVWWPDSGALRRPAGLGYHSAAPSFLGQ